MNNVQPGILASAPPLARYLTFSLTPGADPRPALQAASAIIDGDNIVVGLGKSLALALGRTIDGLHSFPVYDGAGFGVPATPAALWCWLRGTDRGALLHRGRELERLLATAFVAEKRIDGFQYGTGRDLTGYEDGTENPQQEDAIAAAIVQREELDGSSFVAVQQWRHDLNSFESMTTQAQDNAIGRRKSDNEEIADAPLSAHIKRTAQEDFDPPAFILRRSMPWSNETAAGLMFVAFGRSIDAFEALLRRMTGAEDGVTDALFHFTQPISGAYFWCPPLREGQLDLRALGL